ncbi:MAG: hypothetical protein OXH15_07250 [Gammaproteobacteria bacterium]|nr:hypothetical protein [Gammaproteobacteria bacterium]
MSEQTERTLPAAASITYLKNEARTLRAAFDDADDGARTRVGTHVSPLPSTLAQAQALFVIAREYGFRSWPVLKRHVQRQTRTVFSDAEGAAQTFAEMLDGNVTIAESFEEALESKSEVLVLDLHVRRDKPFPEAKGDELRARKLVLTGPWADELCRELDLEIGGGVRVPDEPIRVVDSALLGVADQRAGRNLIEPFTDRDADEVPVLWLECRDLAEGLRLQGDIGFVDVIVALSSRDEAAVVAREANAVFAGVTAHPLRWSLGYRRLFRQVVASLATRELDEYKPAIVECPVHSSGTERFELALSAEFWAERESFREFFFRFDKPTVLTATLKHRGSDEVMLLFSGGPKKLHWTRVDGGQGETLTLALTIAESGIDGMKGRPWRLVVDNFDVEHGMTAELTVRYDALEGGAIRPLPSDASFEHTHWSAERLPTGTARERRQETATAFGFDDWATLQTHVAWREPVLSAAVVQGCDRRFARAREQFGGSIRAHDIAEHITSTVGTSDDLRAALGEAGALARARQHGSVDVEHLLLVLLDDLATVDVLAKCGVDLEHLRSGLVASLKSKDRGDEPSVSRALFGVLYVAELCSTLGREACNAGNVLFGVFAEPCRARDLLEQQGASADDVVRYLAHGIAKALPVSDRPFGLLSAEVEAIVHSAYASADARRHEAFGVEHLLLGVLEAARDHAGARADLAAFVAAVPARTDGRTRATRALNRVMQQAVARARQKPVGVETLRRAIATERNTFAADVLRRYGLVRG